MRPSARDGLFAVGTTTSADGDLSARTRSGETGWALRIGADGQRQWDFCSAKSGMAIMCAPHAFADDTFSLVLTDETCQRGEWILLSERGRQTARVTIPENLCPQQRNGSLVGMEACEGERGRYLALLLEHEGDGMLCCTALLKTGEVFSCGEFYGDAQGVLLADDVKGCVVHLGAELGALAVTQLAPGELPRTEMFSPFGEETGVGSVSDALIVSDGSLVLCGQTVTADQKSSGFLLRLSAEGELLFAHVTQAHLVPRQLAETDTGYAVYADGELLFFDEDGAAIGKADVDQEPIDLVESGDATLMLTHDADRGRRQAVFTPVQRPERIEEIEPAEATAEEAVSRRLAVGGGYLLCSGGTGGVTVSLVDGSGNTCWQTRTPIHTAADRLIWESAERTSEGDIRLTGRYETDTEGGVVHERASALLSADGVLREIRVEE